MILTSMTLSKILKYYMYCPTISKWLQNLKNIWCIIGQRAFSKTDNAGHGFPGYCHNNTL